MNDVILISRKAIDEIDNSELCVYLATYLIARKKKEHFISYSYIEHVLFNRQCTRREREIVSDGFKKLVNKRYIKVLNTYKDSSFLCNTSKIGVYNKTKHYVSITYQELRTIMELDDNNKYSILRYFILLTGSFDSSKSCPDKYRFKIGKMSEEYMAETFKISAATLMRYNKLLQQKQLIYIAKRKSYPANIDDQWQTNVYSRYADRAICDEYAKSTASTVDTPLYKKQVNESRRYVQMYNAMLKGKEYDEDVVYEIYETIKSWNEDKRQKYEDQIAAGYSPTEPKYKDLSIFVKYGLTS